MSLDCSRCGHYPCECSLGPSTRELTDLLQKVRGENRDLKEFNRNLTASNERLKSEVATLQAQVSAMTETAEEASRIHASMHNEIQALRNQ